MYFLEIFLIISEKEHVEIRRLLKEANELLSITVASINTMRKKIKFQVDLYDEHNRKSYFVNLKFQSYKVYQILWV